MKPKDSQRITVNPRKVNGQHPAFRNYPNAQTVILEKKSSQTESWWMTSPQIPREGLTAYASRRTFKHDNVRLKIWSVE